MIDRKNHLTRKERLTRTGMAAALVASLGLLAKSLESGKENTSIALNSRVILEPGVNLHNVPNLAEGATGDGDNSLIEAIPAGSRVVIDRPIVLQEGNNTWWKFQVKGLSKPNLTAYVDWTAISDQTNELGNQYVHIENYPTYNAVPDIKVQNMANDQYFAEVNGNRVPVGVARVVPEN